MTVGLDGPCDVSPVSTSEEGSGGRAGSPRALASLAGFPFPSLLALDHLPSRHVDESA